MSRICVIIEVKDLPGERLQGAARQYLPGYIARIRDYLAYYHGFGVETDIKTEVLADRYGWREGEEGGFLAGR